MSSSEGSRYELYKELQERLGQRGAVLLIEELNGLRQDVARLDAKMEAMEARLEARIFRTALLVNIPSIMAAVGLSFAATRLG